MPKAEAWTGDRRIEPASIPNMFGRPVTPETSPIKRQTPEYSVTTTKKLQCFKFLNKKVKCILNKHFFPREMHI